MTNEQLQACNTVKGGYCEQCEKFAYATEPLAASALRLARAKGRAEKSYYRCERCGMFHLSSRPAEINYKMEASNVVQVGGTRFGIARKVKATGSEIGLCINFVSKDGTEKNSVYNMSLDQARAMLDAFIQALYDNTDE